MPCLHLADGTFVSCVLQPPCRLSPTCLPSEPGVSASTRGCASRDPYSSRAAVAQFFGIGEAGRDSPRPTKGRKPHLPREPRRTEHSLLTRPRWTIFPAPATWSAGADARARRRRAFGEPRSGRFSGAPADVGIPATPNCPILADDRIRPAVPPPDEKARAASTIIFGDRPMRGRCQHITRRVQRIF